MRSVLYAMRDICSTKPLLIQQSIRCILCLPNLVGFGVARPLDGLESKTSFFVLEKIWCTVSFNIDAFEVLQCKLVQSILFRSCILLINFWTHLITTSYTVIIIYSGVCNSSYSWRHNAAYSACWFYYWCRKIQLLSVQ